jgi:phage-related protein
LAKGLFEALPQLLGQLPELTMAIAKGVIGLASQMLEAGKALADGIWKGIKENWDSIVSNVKELGGKLVDSVKGFFKIGSPSKLFADEVG